MPASWIPLPIIDKETKEPSLLATCRSSSFPLIFGLPWHAPTASPIFRGNTAVLPLGRKVRQSASTGIWYGKEQQNEYD
jgi:hypothetical protein